MNTNFIDTIVQFLFDNKGGLFKKISFLLSIILVLVVIDKIFLFSETYIISNKISQVAQIEKIKKDGNGLYSISTGTLTSLDKLNEEIFDKKGLYQLALENVGKVYNVSFDFYDPSWIDQFWIFLSAQFIWIVGIAVLSVQNLLKKDFKTLFFGFFAFLVIMTVWGILLQIIHGFMGTNMIRSIIIENILLNIIFMIIVYIIGRKPTKK